jgi:DUF1680 family protein
MINQEEIAVDNIIENGYVKVKREFKVGDSVELLLEMKPFKV